MAWKWVLLAGTAMLTTPALAQEADREPATGDIVVTAQKREQNLLDVPVAVSVVTATQLASTGGSTFSDITRLSPGLTITEGGEANNNVIQVRGVGTFAFSVGVEPSVLVVVDDVALSQQAQALNDLVDIERIEVLRGPQSTLFGKAASAGVISVTTKAPSKTFKYFAELRLTEDDEQRYAMSLSGPLSSQLSARISGALSRFDGTVRNISNNNKTNARHNDHFRASLRWEPSDAFDVTLSGHYIKSDDNCCTPTLRGFDPTANILGIPFPALSLASLTAGITPGPRNQKIRQDKPSLTKTMDRGGSLKANLDLGAVSLTSITAYNKYRLATELDLDGTTADVLAIVTQGALRGGLVQGGFFESKQVTQELRLVSQPGPVEYLLGGYFADLDSDRGFVRNGVPPLATDFTGNVTSRSYAMFGQIDWDFAEALTLVAGARLNHEKLSYRFSNNRLVQRFSGRASDTAITGKVALQYRPAKDVMVFATYSRGYKGNSFDLTSSFNAAVAARQPIRPEHSDNFELGLKGRFLDRRLNFSITAFNTKFRDFQAQTVPPVVGAGIELANVGAVRTRGLEIETSFTPVENLTIGGNMAYTDAKILKFPRGTCYPLQTAAQGCVGGVQDLAGYRLSNAPKFKASASIDYRVTPSAVPFDIAFNLNYARQSSVQFNIAQDPLTIHPGYGVANGSITFISRDDNKVKISLFGRNLFNEKYALSMSNLAQLFGNKAVVYQNLPRDIDRVVGITLSVSN